MSKPVYRVENVYYSYPGGNPALRGVSFTVAEGESVAILGANASGKSTLLRLLDGLQFPESGEVSAFGTRLTEQTVETPPFSSEFRRRVALLFQNSDSQLFNSTVEEEVAFGPLQLRIAPDEAGRRVDDVLRLFGIDHLRARSPQGLSGGEKKKAALASLIACGPNVVLLDEPSAGLDPRSQQWLVDFLNVLNGQGITLVMSSHDLSFVAETADRALILSEDHRLVYDGPLRGALEDLELLVSVNLIHAHAHEHDGKVHEHPHLHEIMHEHGHDQR